MCEHEIEDYITKKQYPVSVEYGLHGVVLEVKDVPVTIEVNDNQVLVWLDGEQIGESSLYTSD